MSREHPLLFTGDMVKAIIAGRKTQTRRIGKRYDSWQVGDTIWVRETWAYRYTQPIHRDSRDVVFRAADPDAPTVANWRPSIFMPRWASRITLTITGLRVERLQEISWREAKAEGIFVPRCGLRAQRSPKIKAIKEAAYLQRFQILWGSINGKKPGRAWADNPTVKVIEFEVKR